LSNCSITSIASVLCCKYNQASGYLCNLKLLAIDLQRLLASIHRKKNEQKKALEILQNASEDFEAISKDPSISKQTIKDVGMYLYHSLGYLYYFDYFTKYSLTPSIAKKIPEIEDYFKKSISFDPDNAEAAHSRLGIHYLSNNQDKDAIEHFKNAYWINARFDISFLRVDAILTLFWTSLALFILDKENSPLYYANFDLLHKHWQKIIEIGKSRLEGHIFDIKTLLLLLKNQNRLLHEDPNQWNIILTTIDSLNRRLHQITLFCVGLGDQFRNVHLPEIIRQIDNFVVSPNLFFCDTSEQARNETKAKLDGENINRKPNNLISFTLINNFESLIKEARRFQHSNKEEYLLFLISTPPQEHFSEAKMCLENSFPVFIDKPPALTLKDFNQLEADFSTEAIP